jgi:anti-sigma factor RsiW
MKTENLETLLIDRALGELPAETAELLDEYLAHNPTAAQKSAQLEDTLRNAAESMRVDCPKITRAFPRDLIERANRGLRWRQQTFQLLKLAACLALGLTLGWFGKTQPDAMTEARVTTSEPTLQETKSEHRATPSAGFWSVARFEARTSVTKSENKSSRYRLQLLSPISTSKN